jgi:hypothetical protein
MRYFRRTWDETRGDEYEQWGTCTYFFEVGPDLWVTRQLQVYANGVALAYDARVAHDEYDGLADRALDLEADGYLPFEIDEERFRTAWNEAKPINRIGDST